MPAMLGTPHRPIGPVFIPSTLQIIYNQTSSSIYDIIKHIHVVNRGGVAATFTLYVGLAGITAGSEFLSNISVRPGQSYEWYGNLRLEYLDFITGSSNIDSALVITAEGKQYISEVVAPLWSIGASQ